MNYVYVLLFAIIVYQGVLMYWMQKKHDSTIHNLLSEQREMIDRWKEERQQLLDRIQSPTFAEYKHQEVKVIKAKNGTDKPDVVIEQL